MLPSHSSSLQVSHLRSVMSRMQHIVTQIDPFFLKLFIKSKNIYYKMVEICSIPATFKSIIPNSCLILLIVFDWWICQKTAVVVVVEGDWRYAPESINIIYICCKYDITDDDLDHGRIVNRCGEVLAPSPWTGIMYKWKLLILIYTATRWISPPPLQPFLKISLHAPDSDTYILLRVRWLIQLG